MTTAATSRFLVSSDMDITPVSQASRDFPVPQTPIVSKVPDDVPMCTPHPEIPLEMPVVEAVACRRRAMRKTRRFGGRRSEAPFARRRLVYEAEREE